MRGKDQIRHFPWQSLVFSEITAAELSVTDLSEYESDCAVLFT